MIAKGMYFLIKACRLSAFAFFWYFFDSYDKVLDILVTSGRKRQREKKKRAKSIAIVRKKNM